MRDRLTAMSKDTHTVLHYRREHIEPSQDHVPQRLRHNRWSALPECIDDLFYQDGVSPGALPHKLDRIRRYSRIHGRYYQF